ncbi:hypothetical protein FRC00_013733, partial [Tulasnella sp. 408]
MGDSDDEGSSAAGDIDAYIRSLSSFPLCADPSSDRPAFVDGVPGVPSGVKVIIEPRSSGVYVITEPRPSPRSAVPSSVPRRKSTVRPKKPRIKHSSGTTFVTCSETGNLSLQDVPLDIMTVDGLRTLLIAHRVKGYSSVRRKEEYIPLLRAHVCTPVCVDLNFVMEHTAPKSKPVASPDADPVEVPEQSVVNAIANLIDRRYSGGAVAASQLNKGDLVAVELALKKWSAQGETAEHGSYDLKGVLLLRKGTATDEVGVENATAGPIKDAF